MELKALLRVLIQKWYLILPIFFVTFLASLIFTVRQPRIYEARATYVSNLNDALKNDKNFASVLDILTRHVDIATTYTELAKSQRLNILAAQKLGLPPEYRRDLVVDSRLIAGTNIIEITIQGSDPILARDFANALGESTSAYIQNLYPTFDLNPLDEATTPRQPIQPKTSLNLILGAVLGLILGVGIALIAQYLQNSVGDSKSLNYADHGAEVFNANDITLAQIHQELISLHIQYEGIRQELERSRIKLGDTPPDEIHIDGRRRNLE